MQIHLLIYALAFVGIWVGTGLASKSVERLSRILKMSSFMISFFVLGFFTSISELSVGVNSIIENDPEIFVGNLIGASIVLFMLIIPLLAITGKKIRIIPELQGFNLPASLVVVALPVLLSMDGQVTRTDGLIAVISYGLLVMSIQSRKGIMEKIKSFTPHSTVKVGKELLRALFGVAIIFIASHFVVQQTLYFSGVLHVSPFLISLLLIAIGTNVPELSFVVRSLFMKNNQVAFGDYVGSAAINTFLLGCLTLFYGKPIILNNSYIVSLIFLLVGLVVFFYFARTKNTLTRLEGLILFSLYLAFLGTEMFLYFFRQTS